MPRFLLLSISLVALVATAIQYPLSTTFPIGGDAAAHIATVHQIFSHPILTAIKISRSWYPVSYILFSVNALNPFVYWPIAFSWWMALGQILTGLAIGFFVYRLYGMRAAAISILIWAATPITMTSFFEDGTMAQLWSLPWLILFIERLFKGSIRGMIACCILALFSHPITALIMICTLIIALPHLSKGVMKRIIMWCTAVSAVVAVFFIALRSKTIGTPFVPESSLYYQDLFHGFFLPITLASSIGLIEIFHRYKSRKTFIVIGGSLVSLAFFFSMNDRLGIGFWTNRLNVYFLICLTVCAAVGLASAIQRIHNSTLALTAVLLMLIGMTGTTLHDNQHIYHRYESPSTDARLRPDNLVAILWLKNHIEENAVIASSGATRYYEWIPVLTNHQWKLIDKQDLSDPQTYQSLHDPYFIVFTNQEGVPSRIQSDPEHFHLEFENKGSQIYHITL